MSTVRIGFIHEAGISPAQRCRLSITVCHLPVFVHVDAQALCHWWKLCNSLKTHSLSPDLSSIINQGVFGDREQHTGEESQSSMWRDDFETLLWVLVIH